MNKLSREQFALGSFHYPRYTFAYFLESAKRLGIKNIEVWGVTPHIYADDLTAADLNRLRGEIQSRGLSLICFCPEQNTYPINIGATDKALRERSLRFMEKSITAGAELGAPTVLLCPGSNCLDEDPEEGWNIRRDSIARLVKTAQKENVLLVIETQNKCDCSSMHTVAEQRRLLDEINHPNFKAMLDVSQMTQFGDTIADNLFVLGDDLRHVHLTAAYAHDLDLTLQGEALRKQYPNGRPLDTHMDFRGGNNPILKYLRQLGQGGYAHYITLEICARSSYLNPEQAAKKALDIALECLE